jgi:hypothetical protein
VRLKTKFTSAINVIWAVQIFAQKYSGFPKPQISRIVPSSRRLDEGRFAIVTDVGGGVRWTRTALQTRAPEADGQAVWSRRPDAGVKSAMMLSHRAGDGGKKARSPGRARSSR